MHGSGGQFLLLVILVGLSAGTLARTVSRARAAHQGAPGPGVKGRGTASVQRTGGPGIRVRGGAPRRTSFRMPGAGWLEHRRKIAMEREKHHLGLIRDYAKHRMRMREREARMPRTAAAPAPGAADPAGGNTSPDASQGTRRTVPGFVVPPGTAPGTPPAAGGTPASPSRPGTPGAAGTGAAAPPGAGPAPAVPAQRDTVRDPAGTPGREPQPSGGTDMSVIPAASVESVIEGLHGIHAAALAGNIHAKHAAVKALAEVQTRAAAMAAMLAREMSEPGSNYGPEITEPVAAAGTHMQASAMVLGDADSALATLIRMTVGELADSPRQAPHNSELSEAGAH